MNQTTQISLEGESPTLKRHNSFQNQNKRKATHTVSPRPLTVRLQQEVLRFNDICVSWRSPKADLEMNLENRSFFLNSNFYVNI